jgi:hypothetical protein
MGALRSLELAFGSEFEVADAIKFREIGANDIPEDVSGRARPAPLRLYSTLPFSSGSAFSAFHVSMAR